MWKRAFNLMMVARTPVATFTLWGDQPMVNEESIIFMNIGMPWDASAGPMTIAAVASIKMSVVVPNMNICPGELNRDPLELDEC
jgi:hypothetical protein